MCWILLCTPEKYNAVIYNNIFIVLQFVGQSTFVSHTHIHTKCNHPNTVYDSMNLAVIWTRCVQIITDSQLAKTLFEIGNSCFLFPFGKDYFFGRAKNPVFVSFVTSSICWAFAVKTSLGLSTAINHGCIVKERKKKQKQNTNEKWFGQERICTEQKKNLAFYRINCTKRISSLKILLQQYLSMTEITMAFNRNHQAARFAI